MKTERIVWATITVILFTVLMIKSCSKDNLIPIWKKCPDTINYPTIDTNTVSIVLYDSLVKRIDFIIDSMKPKITHKPVHIPPSIIQVINDCDTAKITQAFEDMLSDYTQEVEYNYLYKNDSISATMNIILSSNILQKASLDYKLLFPVGYVDNTVHVTKDTIIKKGYGPALTFGGGVEAGINGLYFAGGGLGLSTNKGSHFAVEYNVYKFLTKEDNYSFRIGYHQAIRFKK